MSGALQAPAPAEAPEKVVKNQVPSIGTVVGLGGLVGMAVATATFFVTLGVVRGSETSRMDAIDGRTRENANAIAVAREAASEAHDLGVEARLKIEGQKAELEGIKKSVDRIEAKLDRVLERGK